MPRGSPTGSSVSIFFPGANLDPRQWDDPLEINFNRDLNQQNHIIFGGAKPVPVDVRRLRSPRRDMALVAAAGPFANLLMAVVILAVSFGFYGIALDNSFWHPEDFEVLQSAQELASERPGPIRRRVDARFESLDGIGHRRGQPGDQAAGAAWIPA